MRNFVFTIVGSGFGLYGYLPAIVDLYKCKLVLDEKYRSVIETRQELRGYLKNILWKSTVIEAMGCADGVVIAVPPAAQKELVCKALSFDRIKMLTIEKPICPSPSESVELINILLTKAKTFRVGYAFLYTDWYQILKQSRLGSAEKISITWSFRAHHFLHDIDTWKRYHSEGGGVLRFYGIHVISVLASLGYAGLKRQHFVVKHPDQPEEWEAQFYGVGLPLCDVHVSTNSDEAKFQIQVSENGKPTKTIVSSASPFMCAQASGGQDTRVPILKRLVGSLLYDDDIYLKIYQETENLWASVEQQPF